MRSEAVSILNGVRACHRERLARAEFGEGCIVWEGATRAKGGVPIIERPKAEAHHTPCLEFSWCPEGCSDVYTTPKGEEHSRHQHCGHGVQKELENANAVYINLPEDSYCHVQRGRRWVMRLDLTLVEPGQVQWLVDHKLGSFVVDSPRTPPRRALEAQRVGAADEPLPGRRAPHAAHQVPERFPLRSDLRHLGRVPQPRAPQDRTHRDCGRKGVPGEVRGARGGFW